MSKLAGSLSADGYQVINVDYPSTDFPIEELAATYISPAIEQCSAYSEVNFVTHSMGAILLRYWLKNSASVEIRRIVMLGPPNSGSQLVDKLDGVPGFFFLNGPAGLQLCTGADCMPKTLGRIEHETGVIAGSASFNPLYSSMLAGDDDGKVAIESARLEGMTDFIVLHHTHTWMMRASPVIEQVKYFLANGRFNHLPNE
ncbi:MAG: alpha/beta hydrolase [Gammaproteobacteria bacterium]|nr:alpha/beta hydrolase [Gammaproteobacteria bacterium]